MKFEITEQQEDFLTRWEEQHIFDYHWEWNEKHRRLMDMDASQYVYHISRSHSFPQKCEAYAQCALCGEEYRFATWELDK